jgi:hypothetical protein
LAQDCFPFLKQKIGEFEVEQFELVCCQFHIVWVSLHEKKKGKKRNTRCGFLYPNSLLPHTQSAPSSEIAQQCLSPEEM